MASLEQKLRDLVGRWYMSGGDSQFVNGLSQAARDVEQLIDQHEAELRELVEQVNQASDKIEAEAAMVTEPSDPTEDERVTLLNALANVDPYTAPGTAIQAVGGALAWLVAHAPTKGQLAAMVGAFADEIEKQEKPPPGMCPTCGHINILGKVDHAGLMAWDSLRGLTFARREPPPPPTWTSITDVIKAGAMSASDLVPVEEMRRRMLPSCAICHHRHTGLCATDCMECPQCPSTHTVDGHKYRCVLRGSHQYSQHCSNADKVEHTWPDAAADIDVSGLGEPPGSTTIPRVTDPPAEEEP